MKIKHRIGAEWPLQIAESLNSQTELTWMTVVEIARVLTDVSTITSASAETGATCARTVSRCASAPNFEVARLVLPSERCNVLLSSFSRQRSSKW